MMNLLSMLFRSRKKEIEAEQQRKIVEDHVQRLLADNLKQTFLTHLRKKNEDNSCYDRKMFLIDISTLILDLDAAVNRKDESQIPYLNLRIEYMSNRIIPLLKEENIGSHHVDKMESILSRKF
jgi:hypothetical protein